MLNYNLKIGLLPIRRHLVYWPPDGSFSPKYAKENKDNLINLIKKRYSDGQTEFVNIDWLNDEGLLYLDEDCPKVIEFFKEQKIDALFIVNCNFGNENCAGLVAKGLRVPTLLWGPLDTGFLEVSRTTDTQCGLFSISKQLKRNNIKFTYIPNCDVNDPKFDKGLRDFLSVATMVRNFSNLKILSVGTRIRAFKSVMYNEMELCEKFGIDVVTYNLADFKNIFDEYWNNNQAQLDKDLTELKAKFDMQRATGSDDMFKKSICIAHAFEILAKQADCNVISGECWSGVKALYGAYPCLAMCLLNEKDIYVTCESDMHMSITNVLLLSASRGKEQPLQGEFTVRNPVVPNSELLWHCGPFPTRYSKDPKPFINGVKPAFQVQDGEYTLARFQGERGKYYLLGTNFHTCDGPHTGGTYLWAQFKDLDKLERKIIEGPYIHHMSEIKGSYADVLKEFCKYVDVTFDPAED